MFKCHVIPHRNNRRKKRRHIFTCSYLKLKNETLFTCDSLIYMLLISYGWMDDLRFYVLFNSISVIPVRGLDDNDRLCAMELRLRLRRFLSSEDRTRSARSVG